MGKRSKNRGPSTPEEIAARRREALEAAGRLRADERTRAKSPGDYKHDQSDLSDHNKRVGQGWGKREGGLDWLLNRKRITHAMYAAGERYGRLFRASQAAGGRVKSHLDDGGVPGEGDGDATKAQAWIIDAVAELDAIRGAFEYDTMICGVLDVVCGKQWKVRDITEVDREVDRLEGILHAALLALAARFRAEAKAKTLGDGGQDVAPAPLHFNRHLAA